MAKAGLANAARRHAVLDLSAKISAGERAVPEHAADQNVDRRWARIIPIVVIGYALLGFAIFMAAKHGFFDPGAASGKSDNLLLGPFNMLVIAPGSTERQHDGALAFFAIFSFML